MAFENSHFFTFHVEVNKLVFYEIFGEFGTLLRSRKVAKKSAADHNTKSICITELDENDDTSDMQIV